MISRFIHLLHLLQFLVTTVQTAPVCGTDSLVNVHVKRTVVEVLTTVATVKQTSFYYTTTSTAIAPQVEVIISGDLTYTVTLPQSSVTTAIVSGSTSVANPADGTTITTTLNSASLVSIDKGNTNSASNNGGIITSWSSYDNAQSSNVISEIISSLTLSGKSSPTTSSANDATTNASSSTASASSISTTSTTSTTSSISAEQGTSRSIIISMAVNTPATLASGAVSNVVPTAIVYSPYNDDGTCRDYDSVNSDLNLIAAKNIPSIRVYGNDCNYLSTVLPIARSLGLKVNQGFWFSNTDLSEITANAVALAAYANSVDNGWDLFDYITIGNEAINGGYMDASQLITIISSVKATLQDAGYKGYFTTSEPPVIFEESPELCEGDLIDFVGINPHSYFNPSINASEAGSFVAGQKEIVENICPLKQVVVTETGYPSQGDTNGLNVPSEENQKIAIESILATLGSDVTLLTLRNDMWKDPGSYGIEQYFGIYDIIN